MQEETGATAFDLQSVCVYSVTDSDNFDGAETYGLLCTAQVHAFGPIDSEMEKIVLTADLPTQWTYPQIQPKLLAELERRGVIQ